MDRDIATAVARLREAMGCATPSKHITVYDVETVCDFAERHMDPPAERSNYVTHDTRISDASSFDEICKRCGAADNALWTKACGAS